MSGYMPTGGYMKKCFKCGLEYWSPINTCVNCQTDEYVREMYDINGPIKRDEKGNRI